MTPMGVDVKLPTHEPSTLTDELNCILLFKWHISELRHNNTRSVGLEFCAIGK